MAKLIVTAIQELDKIGGEFMDDRQFDIVFTGDARNLWFDIPEFGIKDCHITKDDLIAAYYLGG